MGQLFAPRAFGSKKCVVLAFVVRPTIHSRFEFTSAEASGNLGFPRGIENALSLRARAGPLRNFRALLYYCNPELRVLSSA